MASVNNIFFLGRSILKLFLIFENIYEDWMLFFDRFDRFFKRLILNILDNHLLVLLTFFLFGAVSLHLGFFGRWRGLLNNCYVLLF